MCEPTVSVTVGRTISPKPFHSIRLEATLSNVPVDPEARKPVIDGANVLIGELTSSLSEIVELKVQSIEADQYDGPRTEYEETMPPIPPQARRWENGKSELEL